MTSNESYVREEIFRGHCRKANIIPTRRQASKFRMGKGAAYKISVLKNKKIHIPMEARITKN